MQLSVHLSMEIDSVLDDQHSSPIWINNSDKCLLLFTQNWVLADEYLLRDLCSTTRMVLLDEFEVHTLRCTSFGRHMLEVKSLAHDAK